MTWNPDLGHAVPTQRFIVVTGIDGCGKTTLLANLARRRPDWAFGSYQPADWLPHSELPHWEWALRTHPKLIFNTLAPHSRAALFLSLVMAHWEYWIAPRLRSGRVVVMDSYYYRFYSKERVAGVVPNYFFKSLETLPKPRLILLLDLTPEEALLRKSELDAHEVDTEPTGAAFLRFQSAVRSHLYQCTQTGDAIVDVLDAGLSPDELADLALSRIERHLLETEPS